MVQRDFEEVLEEACFLPVPGAKYPFYLVQLSAEKELELSGALVSDALAELLARDEFTHVFIQTHGWNTAPDKAVKIPFGEFMGGMQDDPTVPNDPSYKPLYVGFTWQSMPVKFFEEKDSLSRTELLGDALEECNIKDPTLTEASQAVSAVARGGPVGELRSLMKKLSESSRLAFDEPADKDTDAIVDRAIDESAAEQQTADRSFEPEALPGIRVVRKLLNPVQRLVFGRLIERGARAGEVLHRIIAKFMRARRAKYCLMANSLGTHVLAGALLQRGELPFRVHTVFMVQGACNRDWFSSGERYRSIVNQVAGPVVCTLSVKDTMLSGVFEPFHGDAVGNFGFVDGPRMIMRSRAEAATRPYEWSCSDWNSVDGRDFIDEGNFIVGGHGDFKEDETTMTYWSAINFTVPDEKYDFPDSPEEEKPDGFLEKIMDSFPLGKLFDRK